jgi:hypothetical protein
VTEQYKCGDQNSIPKIDKRGRSIAEVVRVTNSGVGLDLTS